MMMSVIYLADNNGKPLRYKVTCVNLIVAKSKYRTWYTQCVLHTAHINSLIGYESLCDHYIFYRVRDERVKKKKQ